MLEMDFYERKKHVEKTIEAIESGEVELYDFNESMDELVEELKS